MVTTMPVRRMARVAFLAVLLWGGSAMTARAQGLVTITIPASVTFNVSNVTVNTTASPATISFNTLVVLPIQTFRISVRADAATFTSPASGVPIPASRLKWTTSNASGGTGGPETTLSTSYAQVFQSAALTLSGGVAMNWVLQPPPAGIRAGTHTLVVRYRLEAL